MLHTLWLEWLEIVLVYGNSLSNLILAACRTVLWKTDFFEPMGPLLTLEWQLRYRGQGAKIRKIKRDISSKEKTGIYFTSFTVVFQLPPFTHSPLRYSDSQVQTPDFPFLVLHSSNHSNAPHKISLHPRFVAFINSTP